MAPGSRQGPPLPAGRPWDRHGDPAPLAPSSSAAWRDAHGRSPGDVALEVLTARNTSECAAALHTLEAEQSALPMKPRARRRALAKRAKRCAAAHKARLAASAAAAASRERAPPPRAFGGDDREEEANPGVWPADPSWLRWLCNRTDAHLAVMSCQLIGCHT